MEVPRIMSVNLELLRAAYPGLGDACLKLNAHILSQPTPEPQKSTPKRKVLPAYASTLPDQNNDPTPAPKLECRPRTRALAKSKAKDGDSTCYLVRVVSFRVRLLDEDNLCEKWHVDALRYAGILPDDAPGKARIETRQEKVGSKAEERTEITVEPLALVKNLPIVP